MGFAAKKGSEKGSYKGCLEGGFQKVPRRSPQTVQALGMRPKL